MPYVYTLTAINCPSPQEVPDNLSLFTTPPLPTTYDAVVEGGAAAQQLRGKLNRNAVRAELTARYGGGYVGILAWGGITAAGLTATVAPLKANVSGPVELEDATGIALLDNARNYLWISQLGTLNKRTSADGSPLLPPDSSSIWCYLGSVQVTSGTPGSIDLSGVVFLPGLPWRKTADPTTPADTPPANSRFITEGLYQWWLWDGTRYVTPLDPGYLVIAEGGDPSPGALVDKTLAGTGVSLAVVTDGGIRKLQISSDPGASLWKPPVRVASTGNVVIGSPGAVFDGVTLTNSGTDLLLLKDQTTLSQNGVYVWNGAAAPLTRVSWANASAEVKAGMIVPVTEGDTQRDQCWVLTTNDAITLGTTGLEFGILAGVWHTERYTVYLAPGRGTLTTWRLNFAPRGQYLHDYWTRCNPDQAGVLVSVLDSNRDHAAFDFQLQIASNSPSGGYAGPDQVALPWVLEGIQWVPGVSPAAAPTLTQDTYDYTGGGSTGSFLNPGQEVITGDALLSGGVGSHVIITSGGNPTVTLPATPATGDRHSITNYNAPQVTIAANSEQSIELFSSIVLDDGAFESITLEWTPGAGNRWMPVSYCKPADLP